MLTHTPSSPNTRINPVELGDRDWEEECEEKRDSNEGVGSPRCVLRNHLLKNHKTLKFGVRDVLNLKKVAMANVMCLHLTLIMTWFCSLEI